MRNSSGDGDGMKRSETGLIGAGWRWISSFESEPAMVVGEGFEVG